MLSAQKPSRREKVGFRSVIAYKNKATDKGSNQKLPSKPERKEKSYRV